MAKRMRIVAGVAVLAAAATFLTVLLRGDDDVGGRILVSGTVEATASDVGFAAGGRVADVQVGEGDRVVAGQVLAHLDVAELEARREAAHAQVAAAQAVLDEARRGPRAEEVAQARALLAAAVSRLDEAGRDAERSRRLYAGGAISREALDRSETQLAVLEAQHAQAEQALLTLERGTRSERIRAAEAQLQQAVALAAQVAALLANSVAHAPFDGVITERHREPGESVTPGAPVVTVLDPEDRWVRVYVGEADVARIAVGQDARISADGYPDESYGGRIVHIASEAEFTPRSVQTPEERTKLVYAVRVRVIDDPAQRLKAGLPVDVSITPQPSAPVANLP